MTHILNGHTPSSQTVFSPRQSVLSSTSYHRVNGYGFSSRSPVTASAKPSAVRPGGLGDAGIGPQSVSSDAGGAGGLAAWPRAASSAGASSRAVSVEGERPAARGWQDKAALDRAAKGTPRLAPGTKDERRSLVDTARPRSQNSTDDLRRSARMTLRVRPGVKTALERLAKDDGVSVSEVSATGLEVFARAKIHAQEEELFVPRMRTMMRQEIRASDNRHVPFEIKNAIASEQTRILITDLYKRLLEKEGVPLKKIEEKLDTAYHLARANVLNTRTPKFKNLVVEWWRLTEEQMEGRHQQNTVTGEAGIGKPQA